MGQNASVITFAVAALFFAACARSFAGEPTGPSASAGSTNASPERMAEWNEWKFGMFIHWGPWAQTAKGPIFRGRSKDGKPLPREEVEKDLDLYKTFNPVKYDPAEWARAAKDAGMRYAVLVTKHHDGFCNWDTQLTDYKITNPECPYSKSANPDIVKQYVDAFRAAGLKIGLYYSHPDQHHPDGVWWSRSIDYIPDFVNKHPDRWKNWLKFEQGQVRELLTNYGPIDEFWFDIGLPNVPDALPMYKMMRELQPNLILDNRGTDGYADYVTPEQHIPGKPPEGRWEVCMSVGPSFWYKGEEGPFKSAAVLVHNLADIASKGGNFLLDVGPRGDGSFCEGEAKSLAGVGAWMKDNGEAIYGTTASPWGAAPEWGRITRKGQRLFLVVFEWPKEGQSLPLALKAGQIVGAQSLKGGAKVAFSANARGDGVELTLPAQAPSEIASVVVVEFKGDLDVTPKWNSEPAGRKGKTGKAKNESTPKETAPAGPATADAAGVITLNPEGAGIVGSELKYQPDRQNLGAWTDGQDYAHWKIVVPEAGKYSVEITYGASNSTNRFAVAVGDQTLEVRTENTGGLREYKPQAIGQMTLPQGESDLTLKPIAPLKSALMNFRQIKLTPAKAAE
ncbi:MAG: alpha-L-fucosidase [Candidatus Sumerlaeota bacterium]|nr:alpha-L-fucosidase [Candidatus Sumerlaeota bacterium]